VNVTLTHSLVNSGTAVILYGAKVDYSLKKIQKTNPIPGKYDIVEVEYGGMENPKITVEGVFDVNDIDTNETTQELMTDFTLIQSTTPIVLSVPTGASASPTYLKGRPTGGYETDGDMTMLDSINISIDSFTIGIDSTSDQGSMWRYKFVLTETI
ncbi:MAG: hypothetical protein KAT00_15405, partial [Planctomycetes bacterium]|nr:hypothetical protein [Planctomycetota bacterium]